ncbi:MAG: hypothetical protein ACRED1_15845, partial [Limisphaerales bacterium]
MEGKLIGGLRRQREVDRGKKVVKCFKRLRGQFICLDQTDHCLPEEITVFRWKRPCEIQFAAELDRLDEFPEIKDGLGFIGERISVTFKIILDHPGLDSQRLNDRIGWQPLHHFYKGAENPGINH